MVSPSVGRWTTGTFGRHVAMRDACREKIPRLQDRFVTLREISPHDATSLVQHLGDQRVAEYLSRGPATVERFEEFARWARSQRAAGTYICFAVMPVRRSEAVGVIQIWPVESNWSTAEWGFAVGREFWGTGLFAQAAHLVLDFAFDGLGVARLEARTVAANERANSALRKLGAIPEGRLRNAFHNGAGRVDSLMWSILPDEYRATRAEATGG